MGEQVRVDLRNRIHRDADHDQETGSAEIERDRILRDQDLGEDADRREIGSPDDAQPRQDVLQIIGGISPRPGPRKKTAVLPDKGLALRRVQCYYRLRGTYT